MNQLLHKKSSVIKSCLLSLKILVDCSRVSQGRDEHRCAMCDLWILLSCDWSTRFLLFVGQVEKYERLHGSPLKKVRRGPMYGRISTRCRKNLQIGQTQQRAAINGCAPVQRRRSVQAINHKSSSI